MKGEEKKIAKLLISVGKEKGEEELKGLFQSLSQLLKKKRKLYLLTKILEEVKKEEEKERTEVFLARDFDNETKRKIKEGLGRVFPGKEIKVIINKGIIGGFLAKSKNYLVDASVRGTINRINKFNFEF